MVLYTSKKGKGWTPPPGATVSAYKNSSCTHTLLYNKRKPEPQLDLPPAWCMREACEENSNRGEKRLMHVSFCLADKEAARSATCSTAVSHGGPSSLQGCTVSKVQAFILRSCLAFTRSLDVNHCIVQHQHECFEILYKFSFTKLRQEKVFMRCIKASQTEGWIYNKHAINSKMSHANCKVFITVAQTKSSFHNVHWKYFATLINALTSLLINLY